MKRNTYEVGSAFAYGKTKMLIVQMCGAACIMPEEEYNRIVIAERKYKQKKTV